MKKYYKNLLCIAVFILYCAFSNDFLKLLLKELQVYTDKNIVPVMKEQRVKLNEYLTLEDAQKIALLGKKYQEVLAKRKKIFDKSNLNKDKVMESWENLQSEYLDIIAGAHLIAEKYETIIAWLFDEIKPKIPLWQGDMNKIIEKFNNKIDQTKLQHFKKQGLGEFMNPEIFVLWNFKQNYWENNEQLAEEGTRIFPNPSSEKQQIKLNLLENGKVMVKILDKNGNLIATVFDKFMEKGEHQIDVSLDKLDDALYFYQINSPNGKEIKRFVKE